MRSGTLRNFVRFETPVQVKQENGSVKTEWQLYRNLWVSIETLKGQDRVSSIANWPSADQKISLRYVAGILPTMRIVYNDVIYSILNINNIDMRNRELIITTNSGVRAV